MLKGFEGTTDLVGMSLIKFKVLCFLVAAFGFAACQGLFCSSLQQWEVGGAQELGGDTARTANPS